MMLVGIIFVCGVSAGILWASREDPDGLSKFVGTEQRQYERWQGYCELERRIKESNDARL